MPTIHREAGFNFSFYSDESGEPAHVHIIRGNAQGKSGSTRSAFATHAASRRVRSMLCRCYVAHRAAECPRSFWTAGMASLAHNIPNPPRAVKLAVADERLTVDLDDGRTISVPTSRYPRLAESNPEELVAWEIIADGECLHWPDIDEHISVAGLLRGAKGATGTWPGLPRKSELAAQGS